MAIRLPQLYQFKQVATNMAITLPELMMTNSNAHLEQFNEENLQQMVQEESGGFTVKGLKDIKDLEKLNQIFCITWKEKGDRRYFWLTGFEIDHETCKWKWTGKQWNVKQKADAIFALILAFCDEGWWKKGNRLNRLLFGTNFMKNECMECKRDCPILWTCGGCGKLKVCSKKCQKRRWNKGHRENCKRLKK